MFEKHAQENPMVKNSLENTIELLKDYIASEPLGKAIMKFQKKNPSLCKWDPIKQEYSIWRIICQKAAQKIMEEIHKEVNGNLALLDDQIVDRAINKVLSKANEKIKIYDLDALFFTISEKPIPDNHPLAKERNNPSEKFNLFG